MLTQDAEPACDALIERLIAPITSGLAVVAYGRQVPRSGAGLIESFARRFSYPACSQTRTVADLPALGALTFFCSNACAAYDNSALDQVGGFPHVLTAEDTLVVAKLLGRGGRIAYVADAVVRHSHDYTLMQEFRRHFDTGYMRAEHPEAFRWATDQSRGNLYTKQLFAALLHDAPWIMPYAGAQLAAKCTGYYFGRLGRRLPRSICCRFSGNQSYWR
jgi:rhamnosyltransferase